MAAIRTALLCIALLATPARADRLEWHSAPAENLEHVDIAQFATAKQTIDLAAYVLTDWAIMDALRTAAKRGVGVRIVLVAEPNVLVRVKPSLPDIMHLKAYAVDGRLLRTGAANFSAAGLKRQNNDLVLTDDRHAIDGFTKAFEAIWDESQGADTDSRDAPAAPLPSRRQDRGER